MHLPVGTLLQGGRYEILRYISNGGFGCTYEARNVVMDCNVAIKEFFVKDFCNRDKDTNHVVVATENKKALINRLRRKFIEEARALFRMRHPNIVRVTEMFEENNTAYYVMDYIDGQSLASLVEHQGRLSENTALDYIHQVGAALSYVHGSGRLHLDVKPGNIMIDHNGKAILIDFGVSKQYDEVSGENTSTLMGHTPGYAPLEQTNNGIREFSPTTDIYSLGATLYKLVTGQTPPNASDVYEDGLPALPQEISAPVCVAIEAAMQPRRKDRPQSVAEFLKLLENGAKSKDERAKSKAERFDNIGSDRSCAVQTQFAPHGSRPASVVKAESFDNIGSDSSSTPPFEKVGEFSNDINDSEATLANSSSTPRGEVSRSDGGESKLKPENKKSNLPLIIIILLLSVILGAGGYLLFSSGNETENTTPEPPQPKVVVEEKKDEKNDAIVPSVEIKKETTPLYITTTPSGADVYIDGKHIGKTPISGKEIEQGEHTIKIEKESYNPYEKIYTFGSDNIELNNIQLSKATTPLYITTTPKDADVYIDGKHIGKTPISGKKIEQGEHTVKIEKDGYSEIRFNQTFGNSYVIINEILQEKEPTASEAYNKGVSAYGTSNYTEAVKWFRRAADQGHARAQCYLGYCYEKGEGVSQSYSEAVKWYRKAADQGDVTAQSNLGLCYEYGKGVSKSYSEAAKWYRKAADQGNALAQNNLGVCYEKGNGVSQSYSEAAKWYRKAADQGNSNAQFNLGYCYGKGRGVSQSYSEAVKWYRKATDQGHAIAQSNLGVCYEYGRGVSQSYSEAAKWYRKAADQGNAGAQFNLGLCYEYGKGVSQSYSEAAKWYRKAADQGDENAKNALIRIGY